MPTISHRLLTHDRQSDNTIRQVVMLTTLQQRSQMPTLQRHPNSGQRIRHLPIYSPNYRRCHRRFYHQHHQIVQHHPHCPQARRHQLQIDVDDSGPSLQSTQGRVTHD